MELFSCSLRIHWLWYSWTAPDKPWIGSQLPCDDIDQQVFNVSTSIAISSGEQSKFWKDSWLGGAALCSKYAGLFSLARRKNISVAEGLYAGRWMKGLQRLDSAAIWTTPSSFGMSFSLLLSQTFRIPSPGNGMMLNLILLLLPTVVSYMVQFLNQSSQNFGGSKLSLKSKFPLGCSLRTDCLRLIIFRIVAGNMMSIALSVIRCLNQLCTSSASALLPCRFRTPFKLPAQINP